MRLLLPLEPRQIEPLTTLPFQHNDPSDQLLVAISLVEKLRLVSADAILDAYGITRFWQHTFMQASFVRLLAQDDK